MTTTAERIKHLQQRSIDLSEQVDAGLEILFAETDIEADEYLDLLRFAIKIDALRSIDVSLERLRIAIESLR